MTNHPILIRGVAPRLSGVCRRFAVDLCVVSDKIRQYLRELSA
jgi:hypothetical protein